LTATSADGRCAKRWIDAVVSSGDGLAWVAESVAEEVDGVALKSEPDVGVDGGDDADVGVAEEFLDHYEFDSLLQEQGRGRVPEVVKSDAAEAGIAEERGEGAGEVGRVDLSALRCGENVPVVLQGGACDLAFALLLIVVELHYLPGLQLPPAREIQERFHPLKRDRHTTFAAAA
jgi:hypothetical protein